MALFYAVLFTIFKRRTRFEDGTENSTELTSQLGFWDTLWKCIAPVSPTEGQTAAIDYHPVTQLPHFYVTELNNATWEVPDRYKGLEPFGYRSVGAAYDAVKKEKVVIKKLARCFDSDIHAKRTYREFTLLRHMQHDNVITLLDVFTPQRSHSELEHIYFVLPCMDTDLQTVIKTYRRDNAPTCLTDDYVQLITYQILCGLKYIHSAGVIHRDLKPANVAIDTDSCTVRILDFGLARHAHEEGSMTGYVVTRWYRAPEIIINWMHYTQSVDIWSVGCIMAELITGQPLFPGSDHVSQMKLMLNFAGTPTEETLNKIANGDTRNYIASLSRSNKLPKNFADVFPTANKDAVDLLKRMLEFDPDNRITAEQALAHDYLGTYHVPEEEPVCGRPYDHTFEDKKLSISEWREMIFREVAAFSRPSP